MATGSHLAVNLQELEMLKREMPQQVPAGVQRSTSLDSMPPPAQPAPIANNIAERHERIHQHQQPQQAMTGMPNMHNSMSSPPHACPVQRSRSLPLLDATQEIPAEILAQLAERDNEQMMVGDVGPQSLTPQQQLSPQEHQQQASHQHQQHRNIEQSISASGSTCNSNSVSNVTNSSSMNNYPFPDYASSSQYRLLTQSQLQQATQLHESAQPLNLSQTAEVRQILSQSFPPQHIQRAANFPGRQVPMGREHLPQGFDWASFPQAARYSIRPPEPRLGFPAAMLPHTISQIPSSFNAAFPGRSMDNYGMGAPPEGIRYSMPGPMNPNMQKPHMPLSVFAQRHALIKEEGRHLPKDMSRVLNVPIDNPDNNNDKASPNIQAISDGSGSGIAEKNMMPLSVSVSVAFSEPSQDSPSFSQQSNSPALCKPAADQTLSMINYNEDHLLSDSGLMSNSPVPSTLDENFLNTNMIISNNSSSRLSDGGNLGGLDSNPPSVKMEGFDLFEGSGDVDEQNYITDSMSPQSLSMEDHGLPHGMQPGHGNPRPLSQTGIGPGHHRGLDTSGHSQPGSNGPLGEGPSQPRPRKGRPKVGGQGHRYQQPCPTCNKVFGSSSALAKHKLIHSNERRHKCILCAKSFKRQDHLTGHMLTHRSKKPYECGIDNCGKSYCDIRSLRRHFESQHPGLVMEDNMNYTGDERDPELMAAEAAAVQANRQGQSMMHGSPRGDYDIGLGSQDMNQSSQDTNTDSPGSSSSAALQSLALAAQRVSNPDLSPQAQLPISSQDMSAIYRLDSYASQMFGGNLPTSVAQSILSGGVPVGGGMAHSLPVGPPRELSIQVPNPRVQGLSLSSGMGLSGNGIIPHQSAVSPRYHGESSSGGKGDRSGKGHKGPEKERITVECAVCKRTFKSMPALNGHMRLHGGYNNARGDGSPKVSPPRAPEKPAPPPASSLNQVRPLAHPLGAHAAMNTHVQQIQGQSSQPVGQHRVPLRMGGPASTPPTTMHLSSVYTNTTTSHVPSWSDYRHPRPHNVIGGKPTSFLPNLPNLPLNMLQDELTTLAHTAANLAQSQAMQRPPPAVAIQQPPQQPHPHTQLAHHHPLHHTTSLPMERIQPVVSYPSRLPIANKPLPHPNNIHTNQIIPKEEPLAYPPYMPSMRSPSPPKLEAMLRYQELDRLQNRQPEFQPTGHGHAPSPRHVEREEVRTKDNVFRDPTPVQQSPTKKKSRPPSLFIPPWASTVTPGGLTPSSTFHSQMRSPRESGVLYRSNSSTTPPPYTPPPMLSPIRSGTGLYFSVGTGSMPASAAITPKSAFPPSTPSMLQMHRRGSVSASTDDSDFAFPSEPHINVGCDYQAAVPEWVKSEEDVLEKPDIREGEMVWDPSIESKYSDNELSSFLKLATTPSLPGGARNIEFAHHCLYWARGDIEMALLMLLNKEAQVPEKEKHMSDYRYDFSNEWTAAERKLYRDMYKDKGKDFHQISKGIPTKTVRDCVEYYYWWKKLYPYNHDMQKYCHHSGANPNEDTRKHECDLYPDETFLDYVPLKEYRHDKYYRGGTSNSRNNNSVKPSSNNQDSKPATHQGPFACNHPHCDASFKSRQALNGHIRVHGGSYKPAQASSAASSVVTNSQPKTTSSSTTSSASSYRGDGVGKNAKRMPDEMSSDEMSNEEEDEEEDDEESEEGSSRGMTDNDQEDEEEDDDAMSSDDNQLAIFPCKICHKTFDRVKSLNSHMKNHRAPSDKGAYSHGGKEQQMFNHYMRQASQSGSSTEEDEDDEEEMDDEDGMFDDDDEMSSDMDDDRSN